MAQLTVRLTQYRRDLVEWEFACGYDLVQLVCAAPRWVHQGMDWLGWPSTSGPQRRPLRPGDVGIALREWQRYARIAHRFRVQWSMGCPCCEPSARKTLDMALQALPPRSRAALRALIRPLDAEIRRRTLPDPTDSSDSPWWWRRINGIYRC